MAITHRVYSLTGYGGPAVNTMAVEVHYRKNGERRLEEFENEFTASVFMTGLREHDRHTLKFESVQYPDNELEHIVPEGIQLYKSQ